MDPLVFAFAGIRLFGVVELAATIALAVWLIWPWLQVLVQPATIIPPSPPEEVLAKNEG